MWTLYQKVLCSLVASNHSYSLFKVFGVENHMIMWSQHYSTCSLWQELDLYIRSLLRMPRKLEEVREPRYFRPRFLCESLSTPIRSVICVRSPTSSSSTLWLMTTEHSTNLQLQAVANILPSGKRKSIQLNVYLTMTDINNWQSHVGFVLFLHRKSKFLRFSDFWWLRSFRQLVVLNWMLLMSQVKLSKLAYCGLYKRTQRQFLRSNTSKQDDIIIMIFWLNSMEILPSSGPSFKICMN